MIKIESIHIEEIRGLRNLDLTFNRANFVVSGPNGSGKSGVVDAIQFALTGSISRLQGPGTGDLSLKAHGPHVDVRDYPDASFVRLNAFIPSLNKTAILTRKLNKPAQPVIEPDEPAVRAVFHEVANHPELVLARREIIKFILAEGAQRSREVQDLLKLDGIDRVRATLKTTENRLTRANSKAMAQVDAAADNLRRHLDLARLDDEGITRAINARRKVLGLTELDAVDDSRRIVEGVEAGDHMAGAALTKESAIRDVQSMITSLDGIPDSPASAASGSALTLMERLDEDPSLLVAIKREPLLSLGLELIDGPHCPLCNSSWNIDDLRSHIQTELERAAEARSLRDELLECSDVISQSAVRLSAVVTLVEPLPETSPELAAQVKLWATDLNAFAASLVDIEGMLGARGRLKKGWPFVPAGLTEKLAKLLDDVKKRPEKGALGQARDFLVVAEERLRLLQTAHNESAEKERAAAVAKAVYRTYAATAEELLTGLYNAVQEDFAAYYRQINPDDEDKFIARLEPTEGSLGLLVDFYKKGLFPPGAYHSEGHQDGMGVCLYLALTKKILGKDFALAVLDDVVMSVDAQHRKLFCKLLKSEFPDTQFIITTHDQVWARQMRSEGLVGAKGSIAFHTWTVDTGPVLDEVSEVWDQITEDLSKNDVPTAAARLRRHLEYAAADMADEIGARPRFRLDGSYDMGELLHAVIGRQGELLKQARKAAVTWSNKDEEERIARVLQGRKEILEAHGGEQWVINTAIHYNEWANLSKEDFRPVVETFRKLLDLMRCPQEACQSSLTAVPFKDPVELRCDCGSYRFNLREK